VGFNDASHRMPMPSVSDEEREIFIAALRADSAQGITDIVGSIGILIYISEANCAV
jgi:hypothetical protein